MKNRVIRNAVYSQKNRIEPMDQARTSTLLELITEGRSPMQIQSAELLLENLRVSTLREIR